MSTGTNSLPVGACRDRAAPTPLAETRGPADDRWPPLATVAFVMTTSCALWVGIIVAVRQILG